VSDTKLTSEEVNEILYTAMQLCDKKATISQMRSKLRAIGWWPPSKVQRGSTFIDVGDKSHYKGD